MNKKKIYTPIIRVLQFIALTIFVALAIALFCALAEWSSEINNPQTPTSDNIELNEIEQYHLSEGRNIKFVEDILP